MHRVMLWAASVVFAGVTAASAQTPSGAGCLGTSVAICIASLRASMTLDEGLLAGSLAQRHRTDVNGRPLGDIVSVIGKLPRQVLPVSIVLHLTPDDRVAAAASTLLRDPRRARTEQEYAETGLYDVVTRLAGARCPTIRRSPFIGSSRTP
jgi:hypothetical protein